MTLTWLDVAILFLIFWGPVLGAYVVHQKCEVRKAIKQGEWMTNEGNRPPLFNVDVLYENGSFKRSIPAKSLNWSLSISNPIRKYRKHEGQ